MPQPPDHHGVTRPAVFTGDDLGAGRPSLPLLLCVHLLEFVEKVIVQRGQVAEAGGDISDHYHLF